MTLATRAALAVSLVFAVGFTVVAAYALRVFESRYLALVGDHQLVLLRTQARKLDEKFDSARVVLSGVARAADASLLAAPASHQGFMDTRIYLHLSFDRGVRVFDRQGRVVLHSPGDRAGPPLTDDERALVAATLRDGGVRTSRPFAGADAPGQPLLAMCAAITDAQGRPVGAMLGSLTLASRQYLADLLSYRIGKGGYLFITTGDRLMVMHPDPQRLLKTAAHPGQNKGYDRAIDQRFEGTLETVNSTGLHALTSFARVPSMDWILGANFPLEEARQPFRSALEAMLGATVAGALLLTFAVAWMVHRLMRPMRQLTQHLVDLGEGRARPFTQHVTGEAAVLGGAYNRMLGQLEASEAARREGELSVRRLAESLELRVRERTEALEQANAELSEMLERNSRMQAELLRSEKLAALGRLVAGLAHELNTPLGNARLVASALQGAAAGFAQKAGQGVLKRSELEQFTAYCSESSQLVERNLARASDLMRSFKQAAVDQTAERRRRFDLGRTVAEVVETLEHMVRFRPLRLHLDLPAGIEMDSYPGAVGQVVTNLFTNALDHAFGSGDAGDIWISCARRGDDEVGIEVRDNGRGIASEQLDRIFDPFFTTRLGQGGSGLGLYIVHNAATRSLGGRVEVSSEPGRGATFAAVLPRVAPQPQGSPEAAVHGTTTSGHDGVPSSGSAT